MNNEILLVRIEELREKLHEAINCAKGDLKNSEVLKISQELDKILVVYLKKENAYQEASELINK